MTLRRWFFALLAGAVATASATTLVVVPGARPGAGIGGAGQRTPSADAGLCRPWETAGTAYVVCRISLARYAVSLRHRNDDGTVLGSAPRIADDVAGDGGAFVLAMNGGMYHEDRSAVGLYVEDAVEGSRVSLSDGFGNFHMKPNGIFWVSGDRAGIEETSAFVASGRRVDHATQSGPLLVTDGALHPRFIEGSDSLNIRNGVCVVDEGRTVVLAISRDAVNFIVFARFFRDELGCRDALYLDGTVSSLSAPGDGIDIVGERRLGPMIAVTRKTE